MKKKNNAEIEKDCDDLNVINDCINLIGNKYTEIYISSIGMVIRECQKEISSNCPEGGFVNLILASVFITLIADTKSRLLAPLCEEATKYLLEKEDECLVRNLEKLRQEFKKLYEEK